MMHMRHANIIIPARFIAWRHPVSGEPIGDFTFLDALDERQISGVGRLFVAFFAHGVVALPLHFNTG